VVIANIFALFPAHLIGKSFNLIVDKIEAFQNQNFFNENEFFSLLSTYFLLLILFAVLRGVFMFYMRQSIIVVSRHIEYDLKNDIYDHYQKLSFNFYKKNDSGDLLNRITEDVTKVRMYLGPACMYSLNLFTLIILIVSRMLFVSPFLTLVVLLPLPILSFLIYNVSHKINFNSNIVQEKLSSLTNSVQEVFSGIRLIKAFVRGQEIVSEFNHDSEKYMDEHINLARINSMFFPLVVFLVGISILLTVYVGGLLVVKELISIGEVAEFIIYVNMLTWPVTSIGWVTEVIQRASASQARINEFLYQKDFTVYFKSNEKRKIQFKNAITFSEVSYCYPNTSTMTINSISLKIKLNSMVAFVGHIGTGKTTILQLLAGLLSKTSGKIYFDDTLVEDLNWDFLRKDIGYVSQDVFLFSDSIRNNILFTNNDVSEKNLLKLLTELCLIEEIKNFNDGLDTYIGEGGVTLSGGQKQRVALARALVKNPKILILDDVFSNVDSITELKILNFIHTSFEDTTIILTTNRLSILTYCDTIFVLKDGLLIQEGVHNELISKEGEYKKIFFNQLRE